MDRRTPRGTAYEVLGPESGATAVLIHGLGLDRSIWGPVGPALAEGRRVVLYDLWGHGRSAPPPDTPSLALFSEQLRELLDETGTGKAALVGFSLGGMINRRFARDHPGRVACLAILNSPHERPPEAQRLVEERAASTEAGGAGATLEATLARWFTPGFRAARPDAVAAVGEIVLANDPDSYAACRRVLAFGVTELIRPDPPIAAPALVMTCENDSGSTPEMSRAIAGEIAGAETVIVPRLQHLGIVEEPEAFVSPLLAFLRRIGTEHGEKA